MGGFREITLDASDDGLRHLLLIGIVVEPRLLFGIADEGGLDQDRGMSGALRDRKTRLLDVGLVQPVDTRRSRSAPRGRPLRLSLIAAVWERSSRVRAR